MDAFPRDWYEHVMDANMTMAVALIAGIATQALAVHLRLPGIVLLLLAGALLGPDGADVVKPASLGPALSLLTGFAVAVILFEGGLNLQIRRIRKQARPIRQLITVGGLISLVGGMLCARYIMSWDWKTAFLFGTLVIVTGPTVVTPLLRRLQVKQKVASILESEGVLIDAVGAVVATVGLEVALSTEGLPVVKGVLETASRLGFGAAAGLTGGLIIAGAFRVRHLVPEGIENVLVLAAVIALFQVSNAILPESGIAAVVVAGIVVGNANLSVGRELSDFKEQLTQLFIGMLFVLLSADVRIADVLALRWPGIFTVAALILVVRPMTAFVGTVRSDLTWRERFFVGWIGPRGIVAAAVASLFAAEFSRHGLGGGKEMRALVFFVIASSVLFSGLTGGVVAGLLGLKRRKNWGWAILGANELARILGGVLRQTGKDVVCIDSNPTTCRVAENTGVRVIMGNGLQERTLHRAEIDTREGAIGLTPNEGINMVFLQKAALEGRLKTVCIALESREPPVTTEIAHAFGAEVLFGGPVDVPGWSSRICRSQTRLSQWRFEGPASGEVDMGAVACSTGHGKYLILAKRKGEDLVPVTDRTAIRVGDEVIALVHDETARQAASALETAGWVHVEDLPFPGAESESLSPPADQTGGQSCRHCG